MPHVQFHILPSKLMVADPDSMGPVYLDLTSVFRQKQNWATKMNKESSCFEEQDVFSIWPEAFPKASESFFEVHIATEIISIFLS